MHMIDVLGIDLEHTLMLWGSLTRVIPWNGYISNEFPFSTWKIQGMGEPLNNYAPLLH